MKAKKGISPLIAAVILLAFVVAIAAMASDFFTGFTKKQKGQVEREGGRTVDCSMASIEITKDSVDVAEPNISIVIENRGQIDLEGLLLIAYNQTNGMTQPITYNSTYLSVSEIKQGTVEMVEGPHPGGTVPKLSIRSSQCPSVESVVEDEDGDGEWNYVY